MMWRERCFYKGKRKTGVTKATPVFYAGDGT